MSVPCMPWPTGRLSRVLGISTCFAGSPRPSSKNAYISRRTARVWKKFQSAYELTGHAQSVWAVVAIDSDQFLTGEYAFIPAAHLSLSFASGSADNTIKLWQQHKSVQTYTGHTQAVRGLALVPDIGFASCSNDRQVTLITHYQRPHLIMITRPQRDSYMDP